MNRATTKPGITKPDFNALVQAQRTVKSQSGYCFNVSDDVWAIHGAELRFDRLEQFASREFISSLKSVLAAIIDDKAVSDNTVTCYFEALNSILRHTTETIKRPVEDIDDAALKSWIAGRSNSAYWREKIDGHSSGKSAHHEPPTRRAEEGIERGSARNNGRACRAYVCSMPRSK